MNGSSTQMTSEHARQAVEQPPRPAMRVCGAAPLLGRPTESLFPPSCPAEHHGLKIPTGEPRQRQLGAEILSIARRQYSTRRGYSVRSSHSGPQPSTAANLHLGASGLIRKSAGAIR
jgi:hypothetical protein